MAFKPPEDDGHDTPDDDDRFFAASNGRRPRFRNVITTGNLVSLCGSLGALLPIFALVAAVASWKTSIEAGQAAILANMARISDRADQDRQLIYQRTNEDRETIRDLRVELQALERQVGSIAATLPRKD